MGLCLNRVFQLALGPLQRAASYVRVFSVCFTLACVYDLMRFRFTALVLPSILLPLLFRTIFLECLHIPGRFVVLLSFRLHFVFPYFQGVVIALSYRFQLVRT